MPVTTTSTQSRFAVPQRPATDKSDLQQRVVAALRHSGLPAFAALRVEVQGGVVHLKGEITHPYERLAAVHRVQAIAGVLEVRTSLEVVERVAPQEEHGTRIFSIPRRWLHAMSGSAAALALLTTWLVWPASANGPVPVYPVQGVVSWDGEAPSGAIVQLHPVGVAESEAVSPHGVVGTDGKFVLSSFDVHDGAPAGAYTVTVVWNRNVTDEFGEYVRGPNVLPEQYSRPESSPLRVEVTEEISELPPLTLVR